MATRKDAPGNQAGRFSGCAVQACTVFIRKVYTPPRPSPQNTRPANEPPRSPATSTSAHAVPSGKTRLPCSFTMSWRRSGTMNRTPSHPPNRANGKILQNVNSEPKPRKTARTVNSASVCSGGMYGRNSPGGAVELHGRSDSADVLLTQTSLAAGRARPARGLCRKEEIWCQGVLERGTPPPVFCEKRL